MTSRLTPNSADRAKLNYWSLVAAGEPFRLLFPLGTLLGVIGIALWPLFVWRLFPAYPGFMHARIMIEGFVATFIVGFLGTALPRLLDTPRFTLRESLLFAALFPCVVALHLIGLQLAGDGIFLVVLVFFGGALLRRIRVRRDNPPPAFILVGCGMVSGLLGVSLQILGQMPGLTTSAWVYSLGRILLYQGFVLLPVLSVGAFLLPRFFNLPNRQSLPESLQFSREWKRRAAFAALCTLLIVTSFVLEATGILRPAYALRAAAILLYFYRELPVHKTQSTPGSLALGLKIALASLPLGYGLMATFPNHALTFLHVVFITGFSLLIFVVASRVIYGHSGQSEKFQVSLWPIILLSTTLPLAMFTRVSADWLPDLRFNHYAYAALVWILGVSLWAITILPAIRKPDDS